MHGVVVIEREMRNQTAADSSLLRVIARAAANPTQYLSSWVNSDRMHCSKLLRHSITSSASDSMLSENLTPSAFAVLRLITNSNLTDC